MIHNPIHRTAKLRKQVAAILKSGSPTSLGLVLASRCFYWRQKSTWFALTNVTTLYRSPMYKSEERMLKAALRAVRRWRDAG